jgi:hypothetical protein
MLREREGRLPGVGEEGVQVVVIQGQKGVVQRLRGKEGPKGGWEGGRECGRECGREGGRKNPLTTLPGPSSANQRP